MTNLSLWYPLAKKSRVALLAGFVVALWALSNLGQTHGTVNVVESSDGGQVRGLELLRGSYSILVTAAEIETENVKLKIVSHPEEGVAMVVNDHRCGGAAPCLSYQHGGSSLQPDKLGYQWSQSRGKSPVRELSLTFREANAAVRITAPAHRQILKGNELAVEYNYSGDDFDHLHIALNGKGHNTIRNLSGHYVLRNVPFGEHTITAQLVDESHRAVRASSAKHVINVTVLPPDSAATYGRTVAPEANEEHQPAHQH